MPATHGDAVVDPRDTEADTAIEVAREYAARQTKCNIDRETHGE